MPSAKTKLRNKVRGDSPVKCPRGRKDPDVATLAETHSEDEPVASKLLMAVAEQKAEVVADCLARGDDPNVTTIKSCTPLSLAVRLGNFAIVKLLVQNGASCHESAENGTTVLHYAAQNGSTEIARYLCDVGNAALDQCNQAGCSPLYQAVQHGHTECARAFLGMRSNIECRTHSGATPLYIASDRGNLELVDLLLHSGCDATVKTELQMTPLLVAAFNGHRNVVGALLEHGVDIEQCGPCGGAALYVAAQEGRMSVAELLLERGAEVDARCSGQLTPSLIAAMQGHGELVRLLLNSRGDIEIRTEKGSTLAIMAARHGQIDALKVLVELGGVHVLDGQNAEGLSALGASKAGRHKETTIYIEKVVAAQIEADLSAWEASLPALLKDLAGPSKEHSKSKAKRKGKASGKRLREATMCASASDCRGTCTSTFDDVEAEMCSKSSEEQVTEKIDKKCKPLDSGIDSQEIFTGHSSSLEASSVEAASERNMVDDEVDGGSWMQVGPRRAMRTGRFAETEMAIAPPQSAAPPPIVRTSLAPAPMLSHVPFSPKMSPKSAHQSTPAGTTSPFGLPTVFPLWPPTPDPPGLEDGRSFAFWAGLPPAAVDVDISSPDFPGKFCWPPHHQAPLVPAFPALPSWWLGPSVQTVP